MSESNSFLIKFFDASLIPADTNDDRLGHYQAAAADLAKRFSETPRDAVSASRVAIDPKCPASEPWFAVVQDAVKAHWKTFLANHHDAPRQICRVILLEALRIAVAENRNLSSAVWNATSSLLSHLGSGPEQTITRQFISRLGEECENYSSELWSLGGGVASNRSVFELKLPSLKATKVSEAELNKGLSDAAGPHNAKNKNFGNPNPHWPSNNAAWAEEFAQRAAKVIASEVNDALSALAPLLKGVNEQLEPALIQYASNLGEGLLKSTQKSERFTTLLWWKQALYSPSLKRSYRGISPIDLSIATSFDLSTVSAAPVPLSVEFFLREVIYALAPKNPLLTLAEMVDAIKTSDSIEPCLPSPPIDQMRRVSLREFLAIAREGIPADEMIPAYVGIEPTTAHTLSEWTVWLLRERLADLLVATKI